MLDSAKILLTGGTGFVGKRTLNELVAKGHGVTVVTRHPEKQRTARAGVKFTGWFPQVEGHGAVVHLSGEPLFGKRWNEERQREFRASRVDSTRRLVEAMGKAEKRPSVFVCASAIGYYGDRGEERLSETSAPGDDFMAEVCKDWERAALDAEALGVRVVCIRIGVVLGPKGGALAQMLPPFKLGLGGPIGSGAQWFSWVHIADLAGLIVHAIGDTSVRGVLLGTAPEPVTNKEFTRTLGRVLGRPTILPIPPFALRLRFGKAADVMLASQRCVPEATLASGFTYRFPELEGALREII